MIEPRIKSTMDLLASTTFSREQRDPAQWLASTPETRVVWLGAPNAPPHPYPNHLGSFKVLLFLPVESWEAAPVGPASGVRLPAKRASTAELVRGWATISGADLRLSAVWMARNPSYTILDAGDPPGAHETGCTGPWRARLSREREARASVATWDAWSCALTFIFCDSEWTLKFSEAWPRWHENRGGPGASATSARRPEFDSQRRRRAASQKRFGWSQHPLRINF